MNRPEIMSITIRPNPVDARTSLKITAEVADKEIVFEKSLEYAKEIYSGQQIGVI